MLGSPTRLADVAGRVPEMTERQRTAWVRRAAHAEVHGIGQRPICAGCALVRGLGWRDECGRFDQADPAPGDRGRRHRDRWFCTTECADFWDAEVTDAE